jgi:GntR family transcriptional repressor for pyruvate dehydrogenase complex
MPSLASGTNVDFDAAAPVQTARPNLSAYLAQQVLAMIRARNLGPGDRLPSAKALAEQFQVATPTMREALRRLQATGLVDIRHGSGIYVRRDRERLMLSNPGYGALEHHTLLQLLDARLLIEPHLAELAAAHAAEAEIVAIEGVVHQGEQLLARHADGYFRVNGLFHTAIARAAGNLVLAQIVESLIELYSSELHVVDPTRALEDVRAGDQRDHVRIAAAIRDRDGDRASAAMLDHIQAARARVEARLVQEATAVVDGQVGGVARPDR